MDDTSTVAVDFFVSNRPFSSIQVSRTPAAAGEPLWLPHSGCSSRLYGNARNKACESNEADRYQMVAAPPLMHRKGHAGPHDQQRHQDNHGYCFICAPSRGGADERAGDPLHSGRVNAKTLGNPTHTFTGVFTIVQGDLDTLLKLGGYARPPKLFALVLGPPKSGAD